MEYEVGKYYNVKCAKMQNEFCDFYFVPIIGEAHTDIQFGFKDKHYHIDGRFVGRKEQVMLEFYNGGLTNQVCSVGDTPAFYRVIEIVKKRRKCKRTVTGIKPPVRNGNSKYWAWYDTMVGKSCKGKRCPHLGTEMREIDGKLVCPLHNLVGDKETELIINA